ncbi:MAG: orotidine-5'-phosphate decarboxylase [candidate division WOR-3 bacterium]
MTKLILALQADNIHQAKKIYRRTQSFVDVYKIGIDLYTKTGPSIIKYLVKAQEEVFLDLKFCDIPSVVSKALLSSLQLGVSMITIHTTGGIEMMKMAADTLREFSEKYRLEKRPIILGVTILTSISPKALAILWGKKSMRNLTAEVCRLAYLAKKAGLDGVVASAHEIKAIKKKCGGDFIVVVPGIRLVPQETKTAEGAKKLATDDQVRFETPRYAAQNGADYIVVGRPIIQALDPVAVIKRIREELKI